MGEEHLQSKKIRSLSEFLDYDIEVRAAGGESISYSGVVVLPFRLDVVDRKAVVLEVPFLVAKFGFDTPLIGFNVIKALTDKGEKTPNIVEALSSMELTDVPTAINRLITSNASKDTIQDVRVRKLTVIKPQSVRTISMKVSTPGKEGQNLFES